MPATDPPADFSFVPLYNGPEVSKPNRQFINAHLSRLAAKKRSHGAGNRLQKKVVLPVRQPDRPKVLIERIARVSGVGSTCAHGKAGAPDCDFCRGVNGTVASRSQLLVASSGRTESVNITTLLDTSNDPFSSTLVPIDRTVRKLLGFEQEAFFPWSAGIEKGANKGGAFRNKFVQTIPEAFNDLCTGYANLARLAAMTATITSDPLMAATALKYKVLAYENMRKSVAAHTDNYETHELAMVQTFSLMSMEVAEGNSESSAIHSRALLRMMTNSSASAAPLTDKTTHIKPSQLLNAVLWHECVRGGTTGRQHVFNPKKLVHHKSLGATLSSAKRTLSSLGHWPRRPEITDGFSHSDLPPHLILRLREVRFLAEINTALTHAPELIDLHLMNAFAFRASLMCSQLIGASHAAEQVINESSHQRSQYGHEFQEDEIDYRRVYQAHQSRATALAAQFALRVVTSHEAVDIPASTPAQLFKIYGTHKRVLQEIRVAFEQCRHRSSADPDGDDQVSRQPELWLWILWIGSLAERADLYPCYVPSKIVGASFNRAFVAHALGLYLHEWETVRATLTRFMYFERNTWQSQYWFEQTLWEMAGLKQEDA
ncbi:uncharacterized protein AB675_4017 [Cyphellophora attinorum]|uniref:Uncharacterized protein n=1 Tax=Cyphellophora attinorum TaxID=1664694 RepID=A0A0N1NX38_9EURO|nr:uncharacterized protein AB675_4017 [Phialophora attinorum]KPI37565.1 hypothetical protein AB675_4017 [Phialophora attinorum]